MRRRWWAMGVGLVVVIVAAIILTMTLNRSGDTASSGADSTSAVPTGKYGFALSPIKAGEGGSKLAPDGHTRIGYGPSCDDAVRAAFNYLPLGKAKGRFDEQGIKATSAMIYSSPADAKSRAFFLQAQVGKYPPGTVQSRATSPGLFKVDACAEGRSATIVLTSSDLDKRPEANQAVVSMSVLQLAFSDGTWKIATPENTGIEIGESTTQPANRGFVVITPSVINKLFTTDDGKQLSRDGWWVISNAE